jgi:ribonucleoside-diphosphate reductase alpha chain
MNYYELNNSIMLKDEDGFLRLDNDKLAIVKYLEYVDENRLKFTNVVQRMKYLVEQHSVVKKTMDVEKIIGYLEKIKVDISDPYYSKILDDVMANLPEECFMEETTLPFYDKNIIAKYTDEQIVELHTLASDYQFNYKTFMQAYKFYEDYALKSDDKKTFLETFEEHNVIVSMYLGNGDYEKAKEFLASFMEQRVQPATPTYLNAGRARRGEMVSCFLLALDDSTESIQHNLTNMANLSRIGGGVAFDVSNLRAFGDPIMGVEEAAKGPLHVLLIAERIFSFYDQLGQRSGSGAGYINVFHPDVNMVIDSKKENADDATRLKSLSLGLTVPQKFYDLAEADLDFYGFSPYDVKKYYGMAFTEVDFDIFYDLFMMDDRIRKTKIMSARAFLNKIAQVQLESGYPYIFNITNANKQHALKNEGRILMTNLCTEIMQLQEVSKIGRYFEQDDIRRDISCNLDSINITNTMLSRDIAGTVYTAMDVVTAVSDFTRISTVPGVLKANDEMHSVGVGAMDLNGYLAKNMIKYESFEARDFARTFFMMMNFYSLKRSCEIAKERGITFKGFKGSEYDTGVYFTKYRNKNYAPLSAKAIALFEGIYIPTPQDWIELEADIKEHGLYHAYRLTIAPTQSISYVQNATSSVMPIIDVVEIRSYKKGKIFYPVPHYSRENKWYYKSAYQMDQRAVIDMIAVIQEHIDQGISCILHVNKDVATGDLAGHYLYANYRGLKSLYYTRTNRPKQEKIKTGIRRVMRQVESDNEPGCVSCSV